MTLIGFVDIETSGKNEPDHRIIEVACGIYNLSTGEEIDMWVRRSNPLRPIDKKAFEVTTGQKVVLTLHHTGKLPKTAMGHNVVILKPGTTPPTFAMKAMTAAATDYVP